MIESVLVKYMTQKVLSTFTKKFISTHFKNKNFNSNAYLFSRLYVPTSEMKCFL